jgi:hypothetical protein
MKQTAVEWLYNNLKSHFEHNGDLLEVVQMSFEQAKEMEEIQIKNAWLNSLTKGDFNSADEYYNQTYKDSEQ